MIVPAGQTLTIDAGTQVSGQFFGNLSVEGQLTVTGTSAARVSFVQDSGAGSWGGLRIEGSGSALIHNASVVAVDMGLGINTTGSVSLFDTSFTAVAGDAISVKGNPSSVTISNVSVFAAVTGLSLRGGDMNLVATRLTINQSFGCIIADQASDAAIRNSTLVACVLFGVSLNLVTDFEVSGSRVLEWSTDAIAAFSSDRLNISNNTFTGTLPVSAINLTGVANSTVANNTLNVGNLPGGVSLPEPPVAILDKAPLGPNQIVGNTIAGGFVAIRIDTALYSQLVAANNILNGSDTGLEIVDSPNQTVLGNTIGARLFPFAVNVSSPLTPWYYRQYLDLNNTANGKSIWYLLDQADAVFDLPASVGILALVDSSNISARNGNLSRGIPSLLIASSRDIRMEDLRVGSNITGVYVFASTRVLLLNITVEGGLTCLRFRDGSGNRASAVNTSTCLHAVLTEGQESSFVLDHITVNGTGVVSFFEGSNLTLRDAAFTEATDVALSNAVDRIGRGGQSLRLYGTPAGVLVENVSINGAREAVVLQDTGNFTFRLVSVAQAATGYLMLRVSDLVIENSTISGATYGIRVRELRNSRVFNSSFGGAVLEGIFCIDCTNVTFAGNTFAGNSVGLAFLGGSGCLVTRNFFFANTLHATANNSANDFDDGAVGNLWDDYLGLDADGNGIGDTPYSIATGIDEDRYPIAHYPDDVPPVARAGGDIVAYEDTPVLLSAYLSTDDVGIRAYLWTFNDGTANVTLLALSTRYWFYTPGTYLVTLTVIDFGANRASDTLTVTVLDRTPPHADAGGDRTVDEDVPALFDAGASFDNDPRYPAGSAFTWYVTDTNGTWVVFGAQASWTFATPGNFTVMLFIDDASGFTGSDAFTVTVRDKTPPFVPPLDVPSAVEDSPFRVYGSFATDNDPEWPEGMTTWFELWRGNAFLVLTNASPAVFNVSEPGPYIARYFVSDASGNVGVGSVSFNVSDITPPDLSAFGERQAEVSVPFTLSVADAVDNDPQFPIGAQVVWTIRLQSGRVTLGGATASYTFAVIGDYTVSLQVRDASGNLGETTFVVHVSDLGPPTVSLAGPVTVEVGTPVAFTANASDPSGTTGFQWLVTGLQFPIYGDVLNYVFFAAGAYTVTVHVEDPLGHGANASMTVSVVDTRPPTMGLHTEPALHDGWVNLTSLGSISASYVGFDSSGAPLVEWAWGDGNTSSGATVAHVYTSAGNYTVLVRASDAFGNANTTIFQVNVAEAPPPPPPSGNQTGLPASSGLPLAALAGLIGAGAAGGLLIGFRMGRAQRKGDDKEP